jgi:dipeptidyl aminopeptidase/acylaminoacyl peptidase
MTAEDLTLLSTLSDTQIAPDESRVAFVRRYVDAEKRVYRSEIWVAPTGEGEPRRFVASEGSNYSPRWSPCGKLLAFLSDRAKPKSQIFVIPSDGGEAYPLTHCETEGSFGALAWSPDGTHIAFLYRKTPELWTKSAVEARKEGEQPTPARFHTRLRYRQDAFGYYDGEYDQVGVVEVATGAVRILTSGENEYGAPVWSPDSRHVAFFADERDDRDISPSDEQILCVEVATGERSLIPTPVGAKSSLTWSPDGSRFAYAGNPDPVDWWGTNNEHLFVLPAAGAETAQDLTGHTDQTLNYYTLADSHDVGATDLIQWTADSGALFFPMSANGDTRLCFVGANGGNPIPISPAGHEMGDFDITPNGLAAVILSSPTQPQELYILQENNGAITTTQKTCFSKAFLEEVAVAVPEAVSVSNGEGGEVQGWILRPSDASADKKYPLVLYIHGGPHAQYGNTFFHELQWLASEGYVVLYTNPRGSKGYGREHTAAIRGSWGEADYRDLMAATDYVVNLDYVDATRTAVMGGSYGGFMTAWIVGHTRRFTCAIADRLVGSLPSMAGTCDFPWPPDAYFKGNAWADPAHLWYHSPLAYAANIETPLLLIHSDGDLRCPHGQAEELFSALRLQRKVVEYVRYPAESSHGMSRNGHPVLRIHRLHENLRWLSRYLKG